jgi:hypothetical protein
MLQDQRDAKRAEAEQESQKAKWAFYTAVFSGVLNLIQGIGWPVAVAVWQTLTNTTVTG